MPRKIALAIMLPLLLILPAGAESSKIRIGGVLPLTGPAAALGDTVAKGLEMAVERFNGSGGVAGREIELFIEDTQSQQKNAVSAFNRLVGAQGLRIVFTITSSHAMALKPLAEARGVLLFADVTHPKATADTCCVLRHSNLSDSDARVMAKGIREAGVTHAGIIYQQDDWGEAYSTELARLLNRDGIRATSESHLVNDTDSRAQLLRLISRAVDAVVIVSFGAPAGTHIRTLRELGYRGALFSSVGFVLTADAKTVAGDRAHGMWYQTYRKNSEFDTAYRQRFGKPSPALGQVAHTDLELLARAIEATRSVEAARLVPYVRALGHFRGLYETVEIRPSGDMPVETYLERLKAD